MKTAGIAAEYNPFHKGHEYQTQLLRSMGFDGIVAVMSGNFVQRADTAITDKYRRAEAAVRGGVDLVIELPLPYALASAEDFAFGAMSSLTETGVIDAVCCGCESGDRKNLEQYRALQEAEESGTVREKIKQGLPYPSACREAVTEKGGFWSNEPNDVLALSYRKALDRIGADLPLIAIDRKGSYHGDTSDGFESAESIRRRIQSGEDVRSALPDETSRMLADAPISDLLRLERAILAHYRTTDPNENKSFYGMREGLAERIRKASDAATLTELYDQVKTKRFPHSAVRRAVLCGFLKIPAQLPKLSYLRVLAFNDRGQEILKKMKQSATLPVVSILTPQMRREPTTAELTELQLHGDEFFALTLPTPSPRLRDLSESARKVSDFGK